jgi:hypothetical protein
MLASDPHGATEELLVLAHGFDSDMIAGLVRAGLSTAERPASPSGPQHLQHRTPRLAGAFSRLGCWRCATIMEAAKLVAAGWLARRWCSTAWIWRLTLVALIAGLAVINATGVYAQLVSNHVGERGAATSAIETEDAVIAAPIEVASHNVADLDRRLNQVDVAIEEAAMRGRTSTALSAIEGQRKSREALSGQRQREGTVLADLKGRACRLGAKGKQIETEAAPIRYVAELIGADTDSERAIRWLILMMVLCCDPLAIALTAAASARR